MQHSSDVSALCSGILRIMHPKLYDIAKTTLDTLRMDPLFTHSITNWASVFTAVSIISNRETPFHRDTRGLQCGMDLLTTVGPYSFARLVLPSLKLQMNYSSGSVVGLLGKLVRHGVSHADGPRVCYAWYVRESIFKYVNAQEVDWASVDDYNVETNEEVY